MYTPESEPLTLYHTSALTEARFLPVLLSLRCSTCQLHCNTATHIVFEICAAIRYTQLRNGLSTYVLALSFN